VPAPTTTSLTVLRGNSGAGKSTVAGELRRRCGRGLAVVAQDNVRRTILKELDQPGAVNIGLIEQVVRYSLDQGYHVVLEGILYADHYGDMLLRLQRDLTSRAHFYLDIALDESVARHETRPHARDFTADDMCSWYRPCDLVQGLREMVIAQTTVMTATADLIARSSGLTRGELMPTAPPRAAGPPG
jgi:2-phosphoglycerate kinase